MAEKKRQVKTKVKKKRWFPIVAPKIFGDAVLGESYITDYALMKDKFMTVNLMNATGEARNQHINIQFKITKTQDGKGFAEIVKYEMLPTSLKRFVRRGRDKIVDSFTCRTSDNVLVRVKPLFITISLSKKSAQTGLRLTAKKTLVEMISKSTFDNMMRDIIQTKVQRHLRTILNKIYPLRNCEIRVFKIETEKQTLAVKKKGKQEEEVKPEVKEEKPVEEAKTDEPQPEAKEEPKVEALRNQKVSGVLETQSVSNKKEPVKPAPEKSAEEDEKVEEKPEGEAEEKKPVKTETKKEKKSSEKKITEAPSAEKE